MTKRGKILKDANSGPGLLWVDGQQFPFSMGPIWKSPVPASAGMSVEVEFAEDGTVAGVTQVTDAQMAREQAMDAVNLARDKGGRALSSAIATFGLPLMIATGLLVVSWFFLGAISVDALLGKISFTFWQVLGFINAGNAWSVVLQGGSSPGAGFYGLLCVVALAGPFLPFVWKDRRASLGGLLPLVFMLFVWVMVHISLQNLTGGTPQGPFAEVQRQAQAEIMQAISIGIGTYIALVASLYLAAIAIRQFLAGADTGPSLAKSKAAAA